MGLVPSNKEKFRDEIDKIKSLKGMKRWEYIWEYYKILIFGTLIVLFIAGSIIHSALNPPPANVLGIAWTYGFQMPEFDNAFETELNYGLSLNEYKERVGLFQFFETGDPQMDMANLMRFAAMVSTAELDILIGSEEDFQSYVSQEMLLDIGSLLPEGTEGLLHIENTLGETLVYGVSILDSQVLENAGFIYLENVSTPYLGVIVNSGRMETVKQVIELLLEN
jgi:hypothetical protein